MGKRRNGVNVNMRDIYKTVDNFVKYKAVLSTCVIKGDIDKPTISIFIPTYKRADTIVDTISSALNQVGADSYEIVIVNNDPEGETGETREIIESYNDNRLYYYVNQENIGLCGNWNRGLELCRGKYVAMIHDDDVLSPWFLVSMLRAIEDNKRPLILGVKSINFTSKAKPKFSQPEKLKYRHVSKRSFFFGRYLTIAGMTVDRERVIELGGYSEEYYPNEDTILIYQAVLKGKVINVENELAGYRKEVNLSLSEGTMQKIIEYTEHTRRNIAKYEGFANLFMKFFDREYLYTYAVGANKGWSTNVNVEEIMRDFKMADGRPNGLKLKLMHVVCRLGRI